MYTSIEEKNRIPDSQTLLRVLGLLLIFSIFFVFFLPLSQETAPNTPQALSPNLDFIDALWVGASQSILKVDTTDGTVLFETDAAHQVRAVAVDGLRCVSFL